MRYTMLRIMMIWRSSFFKYKSEIKHVLQVLYEVIDINEEIMLPVVRPTTVKYVR
ncbi:hypothetical protein X798_04087, partial [Onchocerca flexuosa]